jgi:peptidoglycan hydrolase CwlO-like protein
MKTLGALQDKIEVLISLVKELKAENMRLEKEYKQLEKKLESMQSAVHSNELDMKELNEEKARTKMIVDDLINSIDVFIGAKSS